MCQLNIFLIPKEVEPSKVLSLMKKTLRTEVAERIDDEEPIKSVSGYSFYISAGMRCNCGSLPCRFQEEDSSLTWEETAEKLVRRERERLESVRDLMESPDYPEKKKEFDKLYKKYSKEMNKAFDKVGKIEKKLTDAVLEDESLTEEEKNKKIHEEVYPEINGLLRKVDDDPRVEAFRKFSEENQTMSESRLYTLKRAKPKKAKSASAESEDENDAIVIEMPSLCIYDRIEEVEKSFGFDAMEREFAEIKDFIGEVLKLTDKAAIACFWQDGEEFKLIGEKTVRYADFKIDNLAYLKYGEILTIEKR